jgi:transcriptional regulator with XRE-family HTH domain
MRLADWRIEQGWTQQQLADAIGCNQASVSYLERSSGDHRGQIPKRELMLTIFRVSRGAVTPNDFYNLPAFDQLALPIGDDAPGPLLQRMTESQSDALVMTDVQVSDDCDSAQGANQ